MGNVIDFGERGLALSLGEDYFAGREVVPGGLDRQGKARWYADMLVRRRGAFMPYRAWSLECRLFETGFAGIVAGTDTVTGDFMVTLYDGLEPVKEFRYGDSKWKADGAAELFRCRIRNMGPRGGGRSRAMDLGRSRGIECFAGIELDVLEAVLGRMRERKGGMA